MAAVNRIISGMAGRYATALFELALEAKALKDVAKELDAFSTLLDKSPDLERLVRSPVFTAEMQTRAITAVLDKAGVTGLTAKFLGLVASNRRLFAIRDIIAGFDTLVAAHKGEMTAEVVSARKLTADQTKNLRKVLKAKTGRTVKINARVDESLLGGLVVKMGSRMIDNSLRTKLSNLKIAMKEVG